VVAKQIAAAIEMFLREWRKEPLKVVLENGCPENRIPVSGVAVIAIVLPAFVSPAPL
jgi:hypothetical protein